MITASQPNQAGQLGLQGGQSFTRNGIPAPGTAVAACPGGSPANSSPGNAELTGDSLWDSLYNTTIRTLSLDGLELLAKSFDNLDPNHQLYAGIAKRQRKLMEYQSEFRRNLEVFCQRANLSPKLWPSCIRHVKPSPRSENNTPISGGIDSTAWSSARSKLNDSKIERPNSPLGTVCEQTKGEPSNIPTPLNTPKSSTDDQKLETDCKLPAETPADNNEPSVDEKLSENEKESELDMSEKIASSSLNEDQVAEPDAQGLQQVPFESSNETEW